MINHLHISFLRYLYLVSLTILHLTAISQVNIEGGLIIDDDDYLNIELKEITKSSVPGNKKSLRRLYNIEPSDQGVVQNCVAQAIVNAYGMRSKNVCDFQCKCNKKMTAYSPAYIYNQLKSSYSCNQGIKLTSALNIAVSQGICPEKYFKSDPLNCNIMPTEKHNNMAAKHRIRKYKRIFRLLSEQLNSEKLDREIIESTIINIDENNPVIVGMIVPSKFSELKDIKVFKPTKQDFSSTYAHAMVVIGYDDIRKEIELVNSFGIDWGDQGFIKISYTDYLSMVRYGYVIYLDNPNCQN